MHPLLLPQLPPNRPLRGRPEMPQTHRQTSPPQTHSLATTQTQRSTRQNSVSMTENQFSFTIFSNNVHCSNPITHTILQSAASSSPLTQIIIITEPWIGTIRSETGEKGTVN